MNLTANIWRASLLYSALTLAAGCTPIEANRTASLNSRQVAALDAASETPLDTTTQAAVEEFKAEERSRVLIPAGKDSVSLKLSGSKTATGPSTDSITLGQSLKDGDYTVQRLHAPERIVVDLFNQTSKLTNTFDTQDAALVSQIRVGAHPDKSRIVLDIVGDSSVVHTSSLNNGSLVLTLTNGSTSKTAQLQTEQLENSELRDPPSLALGNEALRNESRGTPRNEIQLAAAEELAEQQAARPRLSTVQIATAPNGGNMIVAEVGTGELANRYNLKRTAPSEYVLTVAGASIDPMTTQTVIAPAGSGTIRSVRPVIQGDDVLLRVFVSPTATLAARSEGNKLIVSQVTSNAAEMRAQFAPEVDKKPAEVIKAPKAGEVAQLTEPKSEVKVEPVAAKDTSSSDVSSVASLLDEESTYTGRLISLDLQDTDIDNALRIIAEVSNLNIIASEDVTGKITLRLIDVPWDQALDVILKTNGLDKVQEGNVVRIAPVEKLRQEREALKQAQTAQRDLEPLSVEYVRISYAKSSDLKPLVESVLSERGSVAYDERTNQLIIKDIRDGLRNVAKLVSKLDLRTPQILLETQIVESSRSLERELGSQLGFDFRMTTETGNPTGYNFPNNVTIGGSPALGTAAGVASGNASSFPAAVGPTGGSALSIALGSADGTRSLNALLSAKETEGSARVVSRPSVATTNNKQALIKAIEKVRVKLPSGGLSVATGSQATASGSGNTATETIEVGITLEVTPQASPDYYVLMDIRAKSSNFGSKVVEGIPSEIERSATSTVLVSSGQTFAMGGIYNINDTDNVTGVPFLKDIPVLGTFFRNNGIKKGDQELIFFITPRIIEGSFDDAAMRSSAS